MSKVIFLIISFAVVQFNLNAQNRIEQSNEPIFFDLKSHDPKIKELPAKSFYESKSDWQYIIDTTWGPGLPLITKQQIFSDYATAIRENFDGFESLQMSLASWDSLRAYYYNLIDDSTSKGAFSAIMSHFSYSLKDMHTKAADTTVILSELNPGVPILLLGSRCTVEHFGAITTVLPDSTTLVLRVVPNHPLNLEPGDIILGYEGVPWKDLVHELFNAGLPMFVYPIGGCESAYTYHSLFGAGINWHLFSTIDILKYSTGDTVNLSVLPLLSLNISPIVNNEQMPIPNIPFPNILEGQCVTYGILNSTNIGYIYLAGEYPQANADAQLYEAVNSLKNTDALIIDMRFNIGGWAFFSNSLQLLFNESHLTIEDSYRCNTSNFTLCPSGNSNTFRVPGNPTTFYDRPIAIFLGPSCGSMGDITAQRLRYHPMVRFFGASSLACLGAFSSIENFPGWYLIYSISDMYHLSRPDEYLNRREFPIDFPVWHNRDDVAAGKDAVIEMALYWINNVVYPHNIITDKFYYSPHEDTVNIHTTIENPNSHQLSARAYLKTSEGVLIDSVDLAEQILTKGEENWTGDFIAPISEEFYNISVTAFDQTDITTFSLPNATKFTTAGPLTVDSIVSAPISNFRYSIKPYIRNNGTQTQIENITIELICDDPWVTDIYPSQRLCPNLAPGQIAGLSQLFAVTYDSATFPGYFKFTFEISSGGIPYWLDSVETIVTGIEEEAPVPLAFNLDQNYPNPFNPSTTISWQSPIGSHQTIKLFDVLGKEVETIVDGYYKAGNHSTLYIVNSALPSGVYFYQLKAGEYIQTKKMILIK